MRKYVLLRHDGLYAGNDICCDKQDSTAKLSEALVCNASEAWGLIKDNEIFKAAVEVEATYSIATGKKPLP